MSSQLRIWPFHSRSVFFTYFAYKVGEGVGMAPCVSLHTCLYTVMAIRRRYTKIC